jgi:hypothetical protein
LIASKTRAWSNEIQIESNSASCKTDCQQNERAEKMSATSKPAWEPDSPLMRVTTESSMANRALRDYAALGPTRSLAKLINRYRSESEVSTGIKPPTRRLATMAGWSSRFDWVARVARYDELLAIEDQALWEERRRQVREFDWDLGGQLRQRVISFLDRLPEFIESKMSDPIRDEDTGEVYRVLTVGLNTNLSQLAQASRISSELMRLASEQPTEIWELLDGAALDGAIKRTVDQLANPGEAPAVEEPAGSPGPDGG